MANNYNYHAASQGPSPRTPNRPMQYFTSQSNQGHGTSPMRFSGSTPNYQHRPPRVQYSGHFSSGAEPRHGESPYDSGYPNSGRSAYTPRYTPSPVRPRNFNNSLGANSLNTSYGRGGYTFRGRGSRVGIL